MITVLHDLPRSIPTNFPTMKNKTSKLDGRLRSFYACIEQCKTLVNKFTMEASWFEKVFKHTNYKDEFESLNAQLN